MLIDVVPRNSFPGIDVIEVGMRFETEMEDGSVVLVRVIDVDDKTVTVDGNHELAGRDIRFDLEVIEVRQATETELQFIISHGLRNCLSAEIEIISFSCSIKAEISRTDVR